jgi:predicted DNA-binding transcriptional regulator YafY
MSHPSLQRQWRLLEVLHGKRLGHSVRRLLDELGTSKATLYRDLRLLQEAGFPISKEEQNGEVRYRLIGEPMPAVQPTVRQVLALRLARRMLAPLQGTKILRELDALLPRKAPADGRTPVVEVPLPHVVGEPSIASAVELAMTAGRRIAFMYAATRGAPSLRKVDPLALHVRDGQLYLNAFDVDRGALRTFKFVRISSPQVLDEKAQPHAEYDEARVFAHAAKVWDGPLADVEVRISPRGARFVQEWPLVPSQRVDPQADGSVVVRARVAGIVEALRWVLRWGKDAIALQPPELRAAALEELTGALAAYDAEGVSRS